jgi:hypothetical protein
MATDGAATELNTVGKLIERLQEFDPSMLVQIHDPLNDEVGSIASVTEKLDDSQIVILSYVNNLGDEQLSS